MGVTTLHPSGQYTRPRSAIVTTVVYIEAAPIVVAVGGEADPSARPIVVRRLHRRGTR
jgi:hypothetical protein